MKKPLLIKPSFLLWEEMVVVIKICGLNLNDFNKVVYQKEKVVLDKKSLAQVEKNFQ